MKLWQIGLLIFILGGLTNTVLMKNDISGISRELTRLATLSGIIVLIVGVFRRKK